MTTATTARRSSVNPGFDASEDASSEADIVSWINRAQRSGNLASLSALSAFQRQMDRYPQLELNVISHLFLQVRDGEEALATLQNSKRLGDRKIKALQSRIKQGDLAVEAIAGSTFRLMLVICRELAERRYGKERANEALGDLVGEANVALVESIRKFDPSYGPSFPTYAARVIRNQVRYTLSRGGMVRSTASWSRMRRIAAVRVPLLAAQLGREPTEAEVHANLMEYCLEWAEQHLTTSEARLPADKRQERMMEKLTKQGMIGALNNLSDVILAAQPVASLDAPVAGTDGALLADMVAAPTADGFDELELGELRDTLADVLATLTEREQRILQLRYGMVDGESWTYNMIGAEFSVTPERIRQIERKVLNKLRGPSMMRDKLASFLPGLDGVDLDTTLDVDS